MIMHSKQYYDWIKPDVLIKYKGHYCTVLTEPEIEDNAWVCTIKEYFFFGQFKVRCMDCKVP